MKNITTLFTLIFAVCCSQLIAQPMDLDKLAAAEKEMEKEEYYTALEWYVDAYEEGEEGVQDDIDVIHNIAALYYKLRNFKKAISWYRNLIRKDKDEKYPLANMYLGHALKYDGKYKDAIEAFDVFITIATDERLKALSEIAKKGAALAITLPDADEAIEVQNKTTRSLNSAYTEWSPFIVNEKELYYTGLQSDVVVVKKEPKGNYFSKLYKSVKVKDNWSKGEELGNTINKFGAHTGNVTMSDDRNHLYFTKCVMKGQKLMKCQIYVSEKQDGKWSEAKKVTGINGDSYNSKQPSYGKVNGQDALFFVSDMAGGKGGWDIYYAVKKGDALSFDPPVNLDAPVNTIGDDETPFYHEDKLYFSSTGHPGLGGYDIFEAAQKGATWSKVANLGKSFNTPFDDLYYVVDDSGYHGFLVSNRKKSKTLSESATFDEKDRWRTSGDDIFEFTAPIPVLANLDIRVYDKETKQPVTGVTISLIDERAGEARIKTNPRGNTFGFMLDNEKAYKLMAERDCYFLDSTNISTIGIKESKTYLTEFYITKEPRKFTVKETKIPKKAVASQPIVLDNIFYDYNKWDILAESRPELEQLANFLKQYPTMVIELSSHTDARGNDAYNKKLSQRRADASKNYLVSIGITADRIVSVGKGESEIRNECLNGVKCEDVYPGEPTRGHRYNRRTQFQILSGPKEFTTEAIEGYDIVKDTVWQECVPTGEGTGIIENSGIMPPNPDVIDELPTTEVVVNKEMHDFGKVKKGEKLEYEFEITNIGKHDLIIEFASGSCGCTVPTYPEEPIKPGASAKIKVVYDTSDKKPGQDEQEVQIIANTEPIVTLMGIKAEIVEE